MRDPLLIIGIDAAEADLIRRFVDQGHLPHLAGLVSDRGLGTVTSPAWLGSGAVWPTFMTGHGPESHGLFGEYAWDSRAMSLATPDFRRITPFWADLAAAGRRVAIIDVPFAPVLDDDRVIQILDWGAHDWFGSPPTVRPASAVAALGDALKAVHPLVAGPVDSTAPDDVDGLRHVIASCVSGATLRGSLAARVLEAIAPDALIVVFSEIHRASHLLLHTVDPSHPAWREGVGSLPDDVMSGLIEIFRAVDAQVGRLMAPRQGSPTLVFSLHGMKNTRGVPSFLSDVLERWGYAQRRPWWRHSARQHAGRAFKLAKRLTPEPIKQLYYGSVPKATTLRLAQPSMPIPPWDWRRTRAFSLPTDQHGWIRLNLQGREAQGIVQQSSYRQTVDELRERLETLSSLEGPLVDGVALPGNGAPPDGLPDLVIHWSRNAARAHLRLLDPSLSSRPVGLKNVGQHKPDGFFAASGSAFAAWPAIVDATELSSRIRQAVMS